MGTAGHWGPVELPIEIGPQPSPTEKVDRYQLSPVSPVGRLGPTKMADDPIMIFGGAGRQAGSEFQRCSFSWGLIGISARGDLAVWYSSDFPSTWRSWHTTCMGLARGEREGQRLRLVLGRVVAVVLPLAHDLARASVWEYLIWSLGPQRFLTQSLSLWLSGDNSSYSTIALGRSVCRIKV